MRICPPARDRGARRAYHIRMHTRTLPRPPGAPLDPATRARLRAYLLRAHWRPTCAAVGVDAGVLRRAMAGQRIRSSSALAIRLVVSTAAQETRP
jgi:hypothetical protein